MTTVELQKISKILGGKKVLRREIHSILDLIKLGGRGVTKTALINLANYLNLSVRQIAQLLPVSERTILRYNARKPFNRAVSEQILRIAEIAVRGVEVFEDKQTFVALRRLVYWWNRYIHRTQQCRRLRLSNRFIE